MVSPHVYAYFTESEEQFDGSDLADVPEPDIDDRFALCGPGYEVQYNIQRTRNPRFRLLVAAAPGEKHHDPELVAFVAKVNKYFQTQASTFIKKRRDDLGRADLELTLLLRKEGLMAAYNLPTPKQKRKAPPPQRIVGQRILRPVSRWWYRVKGEHRKHRRALTKTT